MKFHLINLTKPVLRATTIMGVLVLAGCDADNGAGDTGDDNAALEEAEEERGPHNGRLLRDGPFSVEVTIFESGRPPQYRVFAYLDDEPVDPGAVDLDISLGRLGGRTDQFAFTAEADYMASAEIVAEPHSFDVSVRAGYGGGRHSWDYESYEGRTTIPAATAEEAGVTIAQTGPATLLETVDVLGEVVIAPDAQATVRARFPGQVLGVFKTVGDPVRAGERLATVESNQSLQAYDIVAPMDGTVIERLTNTGDVAGDQPLFVIGDLTRLHADFHIFTRDLGRVQVGQPVTISAIDGALDAETTIATFLPTSGTAAQTVVARAALPNPDANWVPGMTVKGTIVVGEFEVPLAVRTEALQRFRDFTVVYFRFGDTYEVRMLDLGRQTSDWTEVLGGIDLGLDYVVDNSFLIKADIEKSGATHDH